MANFLQDLNNGSFGNPKYIDKFKSTSDTLMKQLEQPKEDIKPVNFLNFGPGVSQKGVTNVKDFMVANKTPAIQQTAPIPQNGGFSLLPTANAETPETPTFDDKDIEAVRYLLENGFTQEEALNKVVEYKKQLEQPTPIEQPAQNPYLTGEEQTWGDIGLNITGNIYKGVENLGADVINIGSKAIGSDFRVKPLREQLFNTGEEYKGGVTQNIANVIEKRGNKLGDIVLNNENQTGIETQFQGVANLGAGITDVIGTGFMAGLSTLTPDKQKEELTRIINGIAQTEGGVKAIEKAKEIKKSYEEFKKENPRAGRNVSAVLDTLNFGVNSGVIKIGDKVIKTGINKTVNAVDKGISKVGQGINTFKTEVKEGLDRGFNIPGKGKTVVDPVKAEKRASFLDTVKTGLTKEEIEGYRSNPEQINEFDKLTERMDSEKGVDSIDHYKTERVSDITEELVQKIDEFKKSKAETGEAYNDVKNFNIEVDPTDAFIKIDESLSKFGIEKNADGVYVAKEGFSGGGYSQADINAINDFMARLRFEAQNGTITPKQFLEARNLTRDLAGYDKTQTTKSNDIFQQIRRDLNERIRQQIPGLDYLDKNFSDKIDLLDDYTRDLIYKGGDVKGDFKSNLESIISNLDKSSRKDLLNRLEEIMPGIGNKIKAVNNIPKLYKALNDEGRFSKFTGLSGAMAGATTGATLLGPIGSAIGFLVGLGGGQVLGRGLGTVKRTNIKKVLKNFNAEGKKQIIEVQEKVKKGEQLSANEKYLIEKLKKYYADENAKTEAKAKQQADNINNLKREKAEAEAKKQKEQEESLKKPNRQLPPGKKEPIITPQTKENAVIQQSKSDLQKAKIGTTTPQPKLLKKSPLSDREKAIIRQEANTLKKESQTTPLISGDKTPQVLETPNKDMVVPKPKVGFKIGDKRPLKKEPTTAEKVVSDTTQAKENKPLLKKENEIIKSDNTFDIEGNKFEFFSNTGNGLTDYKEAPGLKINGKEILLPGSKNADGFLDKEALLTVLEEEKGNYKRYSTLSPKSQENYVKIITSGVDIGELNKIFNYNKSAVKTNKPLLKKENLEKAKEMFKKDDNLIKEAKKYKSADDFVKEFFPIKYEVNNVPIFGKPGKTEKSVRLDLFPKDLIQGKGITQDELLNILKKEYNNGAKSIYPSLGIWTEQGKGFIDNLVKKGYLDSKYNILSKIKDYEYKNSLKEIYNKANPTKKLLSKEKVGFKLPKDFNINKSKYEKKNNISEQKSEIEQNTEVMGSKNSKGDNSKNESGNNKTGPRNGTGLLEGPIKELTGKKERDVANNKAIKILEDKNYSENYNNYTKEEIEALKQYTGVGGLNVKSDTGVGALSEFYTPTKIVDKMWGIVNKLGIKGTGYEPSIGIGKFFNNIPENIKLNGGELSKISGTIAKILNPDSNIKIGDFQDMFMSKNNEFSYSKADYTGDKYELIIGNPPYFKRGGAKAKVDPNLSQSEDYFVSKGLDMLEKDGVLVYIVKNGFLGKNSTANLKAKIEIANKGHLIGAYRLPSGMFKDTPISTEIIVIKKEKGNINDFIEDNYFKNNPQNLLYDKIIGEGQFKRFTGDDSYLEKIGQGLDNKLMEHNYYKETTTVYTPKESLKTVEQVIEPKKQFLSVEKEPLKVIENGKENKEILKTGLKLEVEGYTEIPKGRGGDLNYMDGDIYINDFYKSGNIYNRLQQLEIDKDFIINKYGETQYLKQKKELESVLPKPKKVSEISFTYKDEKLVSNKGNNGTIGEMFYKFIQNKSLPYGFTRWDIMDEFRGNRITVKKEQRVYLSIETNKLFNDFMHNNLDDFDLIKQIEDNYNKKINGYVEPDYSKVELVLDGITDKFKGNNFEFSEIQKNGIKKLVNKGVGLVAYGVGVGKTHTIIGAVKSTMDLGRSKRPVIIVPSSTLPAWISTIEETIPGIKVNNFGGFTAPQMQKLIKERGNDYTKWIKDGEITVITHEGIDKIGATQQDISELTNGLGDTLFTKMGNAKDMETRGQKVEEILSDIYGKSIEGLTVDHLGIDLVAVDEVHNFRKVFAKAEIQGDGGNRYSKLDGSVSKGAQKLFALTQKILRQNNGRNVYLASATPFENKPTEVYNILSLIAYNELKGKGLNNINDFFTYFAKFKTEFQKKVNGEWADKEVFHEYGNINELQTLIREYMDFKEDLTLVRPNKVVETPKLEMSDLQKENLNKIIAISKDSKRDGALLTASTYGKQNSVSPYFIDEFNLGNPTSKELVENSPKLNFAYESIKKMKEVHKDKGSLIYLGSSGTKYFETYKQHFVDTGIYKSSEIGVINGDTPKDKRELIADGFRKGTVKLIIGGDPTKEGINLQDNGIMTYILNLGWNPTEMTQVEGRVWRQGNPADKVGVIYPLLYNSNDTIMFQKFKEKGGRIASLIDYTKKYEDNTNLELDPQEQLLNLTTDPKDKVAIKMGLLKKDYNNELLTYKNTAKTIDEVFNANHEAKLNIEKSNNELDRYKRELQSDIDNKTNFYNEDLWKSKIKGLKDEIKKFEFKQEKAEALLKEYNIFDKESYDKVKNEYLDKVKELENKLENIDNQQEALFKQFELEKIEEDKTKKGLNDLVLDLFDKMKDIKYRTPEELINIKKELKLLKKATVSDEIKPLIEEAKKNPLIKDLNNGKELYRGEEYNASGKYGEGNFWTDDIDIAQSYSDFDIEDITKKVIKVKNPLDTTSIKTVNFLKNNTNFNIEKAIGAYSRDIEEFYKLSKWAKEKGFDSIIGRTSDNGQNWTGNEIYLIK